MTDFAQLGVKIETSSVVKASKDLNSFEAAAGGAEAAAAGLSRGIAGANSSDRIFNATMAQTDTAIQKRINAMVGLTTAHERYNRAMLLTTTDIREQQNLTPRDMMPNRFNTANIAAQFQDIGVTAAMGMNPMTIALQQGTQLSAIMNSMESPLKGIAQAFRSIFNPVSLLSIAVVGLVAAFIQMVNWSDAVSGALDFLADNLAYVIPIAAGLAAGLMVIYAPAILGGLAAAGSAVMALGNISLIAGAKMAAAWVMANPVTMLAGLAAVAVGVTAWAATVFEPVRVAVNFMLNLFIGLFKSIGAIFSTEHLSRIFVGAFVGAFKAVAGVVKKFINDVLIAPINAVSQKINETFDTSIGMLGDLTVDYDPFAEAERGAVDLGSAIKESFDFGVDRVGQIQSGIKTAADWLRGLKPGGAAEAVAAGSGGSASGKDNNEKDKLADMTKGVNSYTAALERMKQGYEFTKEVGKGFFSDMKQGILEHKNLWETLGNAVINVLTKIMDKMMDVGVDQLFDGLKGMKGSGNIFSSIGSLLGFAKGGAFTNGVYANPTLFAFAGGGSFGVMGEKGPEAVMPLQRGPDGSLGVRANGGGAGANVVVNVNNNSSATASVQQRQTSQGVEIDVMIDELVAQKLSDQSSSSNRALNNYNNRQMIRR